LPLGPFLCRLVGGKSAFDQDESLLIEAAAQLSAAA
jgi:hypothetical protein